MNAFFPWERGGERAFRDTLSPTLSREIDSILALAPRAGEGVMKAFLSSQRI
jgi:hypothetical protein